MAYELYCMVHGFNQHREHFFMGSDILGLMVCADTVGVIALIVGQCYLGFMVQYFWGNKKTINDDSLMDILRFYVLFNSISVISGQREIDKQRLCAMEPRLWLRRFRL